MGSRLGVPRRRMGVVGLLSILLSVITGAIVGHPGAALLVARSGEVGSLWWFAAALVLLLLLWPRLLNWGIARLLRLLRRDPLEHSLSGAGDRADVRLVRRSPGSARACRSSRSPHALPPARRCGDLLVDHHLRLRAGVGDRHVLGVSSRRVSGCATACWPLLLGALMPFPAAIAVVVISRFFTVVADVVVAAFGWGWARPTTS